MAADSHAALLDPAAEAPAWLAPTRAAIAAGPEPEAARRRAAQLLDAADAQTREALAARPEATAAIVRALCGVAPFLTPLFARRPEWLGALARDPLDAPRSSGMLADTLARELSDGDAAESEDRLRAFKYYELARLTVRDCEPAWLPLAASGETLDAISALADVLLAAAYEIAAARIAAEFGPPEWRDASGGVHRLAFCVLGLGKLGSAELNYSSDVDLVYVHSAPPHGRCEGPQGLGVGDYFGRVAREFGGVVSENRLDGFLYRVDLELRPEGNAGPLVVSEDALVQYYEVRADDWEKAAFMKARPVAGAMSLGWRAIRDIAPMIHLTGMDFGGVEGIRSLKRKVEAGRGGQRSGFNVKIDPGGIRDLEFIAQAMQLLHGGRVPQLRSRSTRGALVNLGAAGLLEPERVDAFLETYLFLRRVENRVQMEAERQTHIVPAAVPARTRLAHAVGFSGEDALERFDEELERHRAVPRAFFERFLVDEGQERILELFVHRASRLVAFPAARQMVEELAARFAREIDASPDPELALNNLDRFIAAVGERRFYWELLLDRPELVPRLSALFGASRFLSNFFASHPRLIEPVFDNPDVLLLDRDALRRDLHAMQQAGAADDVEFRMDALRLFHHRQVINVGLLDISEVVSRAEVEGALTDIAELCLDDAIDIARHALTRRGVPEAAERGAFLVVGMGKLASRELSYGSDLDLIFLFDTPVANGLLDAQEYFVRLTQRLISTLQTPTAEGACYEIDARLRPSGNQGTLVSSRAAFERYHAQKAESWERQALLRARPVVGSDTLAAAFDALRREILGAAPAPALASEIHHVRLRMQTELAKETPHRFNFKTGRGGALDVESVVQYLALRHAHAHPALLEVLRVEEAIARLSSLGLLDPAHARALDEGWEFLQRLGNRLRIVENRSISDLDQERGDLDGLARRLGYARGKAAAGARRALLADYRTHTEAIRAVYLAVLGVEEA